MTNLCIQSFFSSPLSKGALSGGIVSVIFMLWISIGGNFSRLSGQTVYETKSLSINACPEAWNITEEVISEPMTGNYQLI